MKGMMQMDKLTSLLSGKKKILTMILGVVSGLSIVFGLDQGDVNIIAGAVVAVSSVVGYIATEGRIDLERIKAAAESVNDVIDSFKGKEEPKDVQE